MVHPYQCLLYCPGFDQAQYGVVVAASGPYIHTFSTRNGSRISTWPPINATEQYNTKQFPISIDQSVPEADIAAFERPRKRRKLPPAREDSGSSAEIVVGGGSKDIDRLETKQPSSPPIVNLACTSTGQHVVAVTGEDKCIRVFELTAGGIINQLTERHMAKRPCAITLTTDDSTILCADKFGDVYSMPLTGKTIEPSATISDAIEDFKIKTDEALQPSFIPSATSLTVHTKRNRESLRQQQKVTNPKAEKRSLNFDHQLLLGHVSLLTDVAYASAASSLLKPRDYILTSDRDEHIRVSRGIPQAHIIEGFCLGHTEFVSKLCIPRAYPHLLISGGGDDYLLAWDWIVGSIRQKIDMKGHVKSFKEQYFRNSALANNQVGIQEPAANGENSEIQIEVTNILVLETQTATEIVVTCEGVPGLFMFLVDSDAKVSFKASVSLEGNVIDVVFIPQSESVICSMDAVHQPFSTTIVASAQAQELRPSVGAVQATKLGWKRDTEATRKLVAVMQDCLEDQSSVVEDLKMRGRSMRELLYNLECLRKRGSEDEN